MINKSTSLKKISAPVLKVDSSYRNIIEQMISIINNTDAFGIAAPQINVFERIILIKKDNNNFDIYFNPKILKMQGTQLYYESCISIDNTIGMVRRPYILEFEALNEHGEYVHKLVDGMEAIAICHEIDHLDGILYTDRASSIITKINTREKIKLRKKYPRTIINEDKIFIYE